MTHQINYHTTTLRRSPCKPNSYENSKRKLTIYTKTLKLQSNPIIFSVPIPIILCRMTFIPSHLFNSIHSISSDMKTLSLSLSPRSQSLSPATKNENGGRPLLLARKDLPLGKRPRIHLRRCRSRRQQDFRQKIRVEELVHARLKLDDEVSGFLEEEVS